MAAETCDFVFEPVTPQFRHVGVHAYYAQVLNSKTFPAGAKWLFSGASRRIA